MNKKNILLMKKAKQEAETNIYYIELVKEHNQDLQTLKKEIQALKELLKQNCELLDFATNVLKDQLKITL